MLRSIVVRMAVIQLQITEQTLRKLNVEFEIIQTRDHNHDKFNRLPRQTHKAKPLESGTSTSSKNAVTLNTSTASCAQGKARSA